jgi:hypothetical protein
MAANTENDSTYATAQTTFAKFYSGLKWGGVASFLIAALVVWLIH